LYAGASGANQTIRTNSQIVVNDTNWHFLYYNVGATTQGYLDGTSRFTNTYASLTFTSSTNTFITESGNFVK
jgi:FlaG/FlaF family flagellin (archaellin)